MRNTLLLFACTFVAVVGGLWLYDSTIGSKKQERLLSGVRADSDATRREVDRLAQEQAQMRETLAKVEEAAASAEADRQAQAREAKANAEQAAAAAEKTAATIEAEKANALIRSDFAVAAGSMRTAIAEYYMTSGKMPGSNAEAGLFPAAQYHGRSLTSAAVTSGGRINLTFDAKSGVDGGRISLMPDISKGQAMGLQWRCETSDYEQIKHALPACEYISAQTQLAPTQQAVHATPTGS